MASSSGDYNSVDKLSIGLSGKLKINDGTRTNNENDVPKVPAKGHYMEEEEEEEDDEDDLSEDELLAQMGYAKYTPKREKIKHFEEEEEEDILEKSFLDQMCLKNEPPKHEPITTPMSELNLVSAFKGSREKERVLSSEERRVSWAPDVYDPPPTSDDHFVVNKTERHKSEHKVKGVAAKNRQKEGCKKTGANEGELGGGKVKKGGGSKGKDKEKKRVDKKQAKKRGGSSGSKYSEFGEL